MLEFFSLCTLIYLALRTMASSSIPHDATNRQILGENRGVNLHTQLWHECAGLTVQVPCVGDKVFYFPQGHLEQVRAYMQDEDIVDIRAYDLPSRIFCKVVGVELKADGDTEEVFAEFRLLPESEEREGSFVRSVPEQAPATSFRKGLSPSDVDKHWGCGLNRIHAEQTFPPLNMSQDTPSQELIVKDLHGVTWRFNHTYSGTPKRHLLRGGWRKFASAKKLMAGDACIFLRGQDDLYIGVSRAQSLHKPSTDLSCQNMQHGILATALNAMISKYDFTVYYYPWISPSRFIVPYDEFIESHEVDHSPMTLTNGQRREGAELTLNIPRSYGHSLVPTHRYVKVFKHGTLLGRIINISNFNGYEFLILELDRIFEFGGTLVSGSSGWLVTCENGDGNRMLHGDFSWSQFTEMVRKISICPPEEEVVGMNRGG